MSAPQRIRTTEAAPRRPHVLFLNRCYYPDVEATGQLLGELCQDLAATHEITVIAGQPNFVDAPRASGWISVEQQGPVTVLRTRNFRFRKTSLIGRIIGLLSYVFLATIAAFRVRRPDVIVVETDPPVLGALGVVLKSWHRCGLVYYLQDLFPEVGLIMGKLKPGLLTAILRWTTQIGLTHAERVVVLGEDMRRKVLARGIPNDRIRLVPNWIDTTTVRPHKTTNAFRQSLGVNGDLTVMYSGNLGLSQNLDQVLEAADMLRGQPIVFLFVGEGAAKGRLIAQAQERGLTNVRFLPYQPKDRLGESLSAADLHLIPLQRGLSGCIVPSKLYGILASGTAYVAAVDADSEVARVTTEAACGLRIEPDSPRDLAEAIRWAAAHRADLDVMGQRGRQLVEQDYARPVAVARFRAVLAETERPR